MKKEEIPVYIKFVNGRTTCICLRRKKGCNQPCEKDVVERDPFRGWQDTMFRDRYGRSRDDND